ncbi:hypothetical protein EAF04_005345 [Stromatinia cepivora]|nr:hypothetical protein EAF04_005345 [Stromatinia cepivora]
MAPKKDTAVTATRVRLARAAKDKPKELPESIPKTTPKTIKKTQGRPKKSIPAKISTSEAGSARDVNSKGKGKGKGKETDIAISEVPSSSALNDEIIRQEATYPNPFSTESSRKNTAALLSQWDSTQSSVNLSPESRRQLVNETPKSKPPRSAKSKHDKAHSTLALKDRGEQTSQIFDANKQHRLNSLAEGKFPDPTYPRASISDGTESSPGFRSAMGFRYSPGFGGPRGFNTSPTYQFSFNPGRTTSTIPGAEVLLSSGPSKPADQTNSNADAGPSSRVDGVAAGLSPSKPAFIAGPPEYSQQFSTDQNNFTDFNRNRLNDLGRNYKWFEPPASPSWRQQGTFLPGHPQYYNPEGNPAWYTNWNASQQNPPWIPGYPSNPMPGYSPMPEFGSIPADLEYQASSQPAQTGQPSTEESATATNNKESQGIREIRMTREKTIFVPGGKIIKTTTTVFTPTDEEKKKKGKSVEKAPEDRIGIVVVDKEGNVDVESGNWLEGFNRIEGWEVEALLGQHKRWRPHRNRNADTRKGIAKKATPQKKHIALSISPTSPKLTQPMSLELPHPKPPTMTPASPTLDFIPFDFPHLQNTGATRSRATRISKANPYPAKKKTATKSSPPKKTAPKAKGKTPTPKPKSGAGKVTKSTAGPTRSLRSTNSPTKTKADTKSNTSKSKSVPAKAKQSKTTPSQSQPQSQSQSQPIFGTLFENFTTKEASTAPSGSISNPNPDAPNTKTFVNGQSNPNNPNPNPNNPNPNPNFQRSHNPPRRLHAHAQH